MSDERTALERYQTANETLSSQQGFYRAPDYVEGYDNGFGSEDKDSQIDLSKWIRGIFKRKMLIAAIVVFATIVVTIEMYRTRESYQAFAMISVGKEDTSLIRSGELIIESYEPMRTKTILLQSEPLLEDVIVDLKLDRSPGILDPGKRPLRETFENIVDRILQRHNQDLSTNIPDTTKNAGAKQPVVRQRNDSESWRLAPYVELFRKRYQVQTVTDTKLIKISFTHHDPVTAATVCNRIAQIFLQNNFDRKNEKYSEASDWLDRTTRELKNRVENSEQQLASYIRDHTNISPQGKGSMTAAKFTRLQEQVTRSETERILKESLYEEAKMGRAEHVPAAFTDPRIIELRKKLGELTVKGAQLDVYYGPENPQTVETEQQVASLQKQIGSYIKALEDKLRVDYERALRDEQSFKTALEQARSETAQENQDTIQYDILNQEVETSKSLYRKFLEKSSGASLGLAQQENNLNLIQPARVPRIMAGPLRKQWILVGIAISLVLGIGLALALEYFDHTIQSPEDINRHVQLPVLAAIPTVGAVARPLLWQRVLGKGKGISTHGSDALNTQLDFSDIGGMAPETGIDQTVALDSHSPAAESYRLLLASLMLSTESSSSKVLLITSSQPGEGKTTTTINTAISLARLGRSVLIIDCDLRTPKIHERLGIKVGMGLTTYLSNKSKLNRAIHNMKIQGLSVLPSGPIPPNPVELIASPKMKEMLGELAPRFDYILIDSPPLLNLADPVILSTLVDGVILVVHVGKSDRDSVRRTRQELSTVGANILGAVLNNVAPQYVQYYGSYSSPHL